MYSKNLVSEFKDSEIAIMVSEIILKRLFFLTVWTFNCL